MTMYCVTCGRMGVQPFSSASACNCGARQWRGTLTPAMLPAITSDLTFKQGEMYFASKGDEQDVEMNQVLYSMHDLFSLRWRNASSKFDEKLFTSGLPVHVGIDVGTRHGLNSVALVVKEPSSGQVHIKTIGLMLSERLLEYRTRDCAPYDQWVGKHLRLLTSKVEYFEAVIGVLNVELQGMNISTVSIDRWQEIRFSEQARKSELFASAIWHPVGMGFKDMSAMLAEFERLLEFSKLSHDSNPIANMAMVNTVLVLDKAGNAKPEKIGRRASISAIFSILFAVNACVMAHGNGS